MSSETESSEPSLSSLIERLISSRNRDLTLLLPLMLALFQNRSTAAANPDANSPSPVQESEENGDENSHPPSTRPNERIIIINPFTQGMIVIENPSRGDGSDSDHLNLESLLSDLLGKGGQPPASKASMEAMPVVEIDEHGEGEECVICLEEWKLGKEMPCKHRFHGECIEKWLKVHGTCPVCRYKMPVEENHEEGFKEGENRENSRRGRHIWFSFSLGGNSNSGRSSEESNGD